MEFELRIRFASVEIERVSQLIKNFEDQSVTLNDRTPVEQATEFVQGLGGNTLKVLELVVSNSLHGGGIDEDDLVTKLGIEPKNVWGAMGGLGRRWSSVVGESHGSPFRRKKARAGHTAGYYELPGHLASAFARELGITSD